MQRLPCSRFFSLCCVGANDGQSESSVNHEDQEEMNLKCNEPCNDVSDESRTPTPEIDTKASVKYVDENQTDLNLTAMPRKSALRLGDLIWGHQKGYSAWPGRIVSESEVKEGFTETGKVRLLQFIISQIPSQLPWFNNISAISFLLRFTSYGGMFSFYKC